TISVWMWTARIAAGLAFILVSTFIVWSVMQTEPSQDLAMEKNETAPTPPPTSDSAPSDTNTLSSHPVEQPLGGTVNRNKIDLAKQPTSPLITKTKPKGPSEEAEAKK